MLSLGPMMLDGTVIVALWRVRLLGSECRITGFWVASQGRLRTPAEVMREVGAGAATHAGSLAGCVGRDSCKSPATAKGALCGNGARERVRLLGSGCPLAGFHALSRVGHPHKRGHRFTP